MTAAAAATATGASLTPVTVINTAPLISTLFSSKAFQLAMTWEVWPTFNPSKLPADGSKLYPPSPLIVRPATGSIRANPVTFPGFSNCPVSVSPSPSTAPLVSGASLVPVTVIVRVEESLAPCSSSTVQGATTSRVSPVGKN